MTERARRNWFLLAAAVVIGVVAVMSWVAPDPQEPDKGTRAADDSAAQRPSRAVILGAPSSAPAASPTATPTAAATPAPANEGDAGGPPPRTVPARRVRAAERDARTFMEAFLRYEVGDLSSRVKRTIRSYATPDQARSLLADPPRMPSSADSQASGRLAGMANTEPVEGGQVQTAASIDRDGERTSLLLTLERRGGRWLVSGIG